MGTFKDLTGQRFGRLTIIGLEGKRFNGKRYSYYWRCRCDCGNVCTVSTHSLAGGTKSCGCLRKENARAAVTTHGMSRTNRLYMTWAKMKNRCCNPKNDSYPRYGGRGITVCDEWRESFQAFYDYVSKLDHFGEEGYTLDRIDNNGNYERGNVRWADKKTQQSNTRRNVFVEYKGEQMTIEEAARRSGINKKTLSQRVKAGDTGERLFRASSVVPLDVRRQIRNEYKKGTREFNINALAKKLAVVNKRFGTSLRRVTMNVSYLKKLLHQYMYKDKITVLRAVKVKIGKTDDFATEWQVVYENIEGALHQYGKTLYAHRDDRAQHLTTDLRLTCDPEIEIKPNDYLRVNHQGQVWELVAGEEFNYPTHKEISVRRRKEAGQT